MSAVEQRVTPAQSQNEPMPTDLGFGSIVVRESRRRLLNRDGSFNVRRVGARWWESLSAYHYLLTISWFRFFSIVVAAFLSTNAVFAVIYVLAGDGALSGVHATTPGERFAECFFFSVHTLATIGYGDVSPHTLTAHLIVTMETLIGLVGVAVIAGISFGRFSRPVAHILFSRNAIIAPYRGGRAFMFRIVNQRSNQLVDVVARVLLSHRKRDSVTPDREFIQLALERDSVAFFPLAWTIVHPINDSSPLRDWTENDFTECESEFLVLLNGFEETFSQTVHARSSYRGDEIDEDGVISVDIRKLDELESAPL